jgi:hypothetical protein
MVARAKDSKPYIDWKNRPFAASRSDEYQRREELWAALNDFVREHRGWITSLLGSRVVLETERDSPLPQKLAKLGYAISEIPGSYERVTGAAPSLQDEITLSTSPATADEKAHGLRHEVLAGHLSPTQR